MKRYILLFVILLTALVLIFFFARVDKANAVSKYWALGSASNQQRYHCGDGYWWVCSKSQAPYPTCFAASVRGAWNCYGGVTQRHLVKWWSWRNCKVYTYVASNGGAYSNGLYGCR